MARTDRYIAPLKNSRTGKIDFRWMGRSGSGGVTSPTVPIGPVGVTGVTKPTFLLDDEPPPPPGDERPDDPMEPEEFHATSSFDNYQPGLSIAATGAPDPYATWILPQWTIFLLPGETAEGAVWRYQLLQEQHPDWSPSRIATAIFGNNVNVPGWVVDFLDAQIDQTP